MRTHGPVPAEATQGRIAMHTVERNHRKERLLVAAALAALGASLCHLLWMAAPAWGLGSFALLSWCALGRPYLLAVSFSLLVLEWYLAQRRSGGARREPGVAGAPAGQRPWTRPTLRVASLLLIAFVAFSHYSGGFAKEAGKIRSLMMARRQGAKAQVVLKVEGMDCILCAGGLQNTLRHIPGVRQAEVSFQDKRVSIDYDPRAVNQAYFVKVITEAGFKVGGPPQARN